MTDSASTAQPSVALGYQFRDQSLLQQALTHRSHGSRNYERLEFLGDSALNYVVSVELYNRFPHASEGDLSRLRAQLVKGDTLALIAQQLELGQFLKLGSGELKSGGRRRASILADIVESLIGAVVLDSGFETAKALILRLYDGRFDSLPDPETLKDPKTRLQEWLQRRSRPLPAYHLVATSGADHERHFRVQCELDDGQCFLGDGSSRRKAEQHAAETAMASVLDNAQN
jgi:ribonuclease-3